MTGTTWRFTWGTVRLIPAVHERPLPADSVEKVGLGFHGRKKYAPEIKILTLG